MKIGAAIRAARTAYGWSQRDLSSRSGVGRGTIARIERADYICSMQTLEYIAKGLKVPAHELVHLAETLDEQPAESAQTSS